MARSRSPSYEPQRFETRHGECVIEDGVIRVEEGPKATLSRVRVGLGEFDLEVLGKPMMVLLFLFGMGSTLWSLVSSLSEGFWLTAFSLLVVAGVLLQGGAWAKRRFVDPSEIRCSEVESVTWVDDRTIEIGYKDGPERVTHEIDLPYWNPERKRRAATEAFERKGFDVERADRERWFDRVVGFG
ncbi:hypothetical protein [Natronorarus salvus]|uniref:hypothetical protein n=1 Tax=Natronorarus salvus TaxID=3117733 RepID=UPI002F2647FC